MNYSNDLLLTLKPSHWLNIGWYLFGILGITLLVPLGLVAIIPVLVILWKYLEIETWRYDFYEETMVERKGILNVTRNEIHYYRIKSIQVNEPFLYRLVEIGNVSIITSDQFTENFTFKGVFLPNEVKSYIREIVYFHRELKGVKEFDMYQL
jgi:membrane protein YdbS with pleckstrin-like domain